MFKFLALKKLFYLKLFVRGSCSLEACLIHLATLPPKTFCYLLNIPLVDKPNFWLKLLYLENVFYLLQNGSPPAFFIPEKLIQKIISSTTLAACAEYMMSLSEPSFTHQLLHGPCSSFCYFTEKYVFYTIVNWVVLLFIY